MMMMMKSFVRSKMVVDYCHDNDYVSDFGDDDNDDYDCFIIMKVMRMMRCSCSKMVVDYCHDNDYNWDFGDDDNDDYDSFHYHENDEDDEKFCSQQNGRRLCLPQLMASHVGKNVSGAA